MEKRFASQPGRKSGRLSPLNGISVDPRVRNASRRHCISPEALSATDALPVCHSFTGGTRHWIGHATDLDGGLYLGLLRAIFKRGTGTST